MEYFFVALLLFLSLLAYFKIAIYYNIIDKPNHRSAHTIPTLRGGGIIFWFCYLIFFIKNPDGNEYFFIGISLVALISFVDDVMTLHNKIRILAQFSAIS